MSKLEVGTLLRVTTTTKEDVFGECLYEVVETGLKPPEKGREAAMDGVKCIMLGGSGPAAREGYVIMDSEMAIQRNIAEGITEVVSGEKKANILAVYKDKTMDGKPRRVEHGGAGCMELD